MLIQCGWIRGVHGSLLRRLLASRSSQCSVAPTPPSQTHLLLLAGQQKYHIITTRSPFLGSPLCLLTSGLVPSPIPCMFVLSHVFSAWAWNFSFSEELGRNMEGVLNEFHIRAKISNLLVQASLIFCFHHVWSELLSCPVALFLFHFCDYLLLKSMLSKVACCLYKLHIISKPFQLPLFRGNTWIVNSWKPCFIKSSQIQCCIFRTPKIHVFMKSMMCLWHTLSLFVVFCQMGNILVIHI